MSAPNERPVTDSVLAAINLELVELHRRHHGRPPLSAKTQLLDGALLACVMGGVFTDVEKTMIEVQRSATVMDVRGTFHLALGERFVEVIERHLGRKVLHFSTAGHVGPDLEVKLFFLAP